jgi:hypothetical protein
MIKRRDWLAFSHLTPFAFPRLVIRRDGPRPARVSPAETLMPSRLSMRRPSKIARPRRLLRVLAVLLVLA